MKQPPKDHRITESDLKETFSKTALVDQVILLTETVVEEADMLVNIIKLKVNEVDFT